ncbi:ABC transporter permease subunit [Duganella sp. FT135W]|uniref:ABC transporter permease subunit n=1 Tax=Duganella flavida TaxID=2692175 RepID=A0A6L8KB49_9BURK|nr:ABC transporter permease [Duganella flavida]MYM24245.1 ABC transporter permease subunit [Duganella flavida]
MNRHAWFARSWLSSVYLFLYVPILVLIVFSFNASSQDMTWHGFTLDWYRALAKDEEIISGFLLSVQVATLAATCSVILGTLAGYVLNHYRTFKGRSLFMGMASAPLVMPEVIIGLSLLLMLVSFEKALGFPPRGMLTMLIGHTVLGMAYATVVIQARLGEISVQLTEAAMDLGCKPHQVFFKVTLPNIAQSLVSAWLLTFTLSLDDVVVSAFLTGPGYSTMPIVIFSRARLGLDPRVNALATLTIAVVGTAVVLSGLWIARAERLRRKQLATIDS